MVNIFDNADLVESYWHCWQYRPCWWYGQQVIQILDLHPKRSFFLEHLSFASLRSTNQTKKVSKCKGNYCIRCFLLMNRILCLRSGHYQLQRAIQRSIASSFFQRDATDFAIRGGVITHCALSLLMNCILVVWADEQSRNSYLLEIRPCR